MSSRDVTHTTVTGQSSVLSADGIAMKGVGDDEDAVGSSNEYLMNGVNKTEHQLDTEHTRKDVIKTKQEVAKKGAVLLQCIHKQKLKKEESNATDEFFTSEGNPIRVKTLPIMPPKGMMGIVASGGEKLSDYGCSIAVSLFLQFQIEAMILFFIIFLLSIGHLTDNMERNTLRNNCRSTIQYYRTEMLAVNFTDFNLIDGDNKTTTSMASECGYNGHDIRERITPVSSLLLPGLGACQEYSTATEYSVVPLDTPNPLTYLDDNSKICDNSGVAFWLDFLAVICFILFLLRLKRLVRVASLKEDQENWTTADYAVMLENLDVSEGVFADDITNKETGEVTPGLKSRLLADLHEMGFKGNGEGYKDDDIVQVELGRYCEAELTAIHKLGRVNEDILEVKAQLRIFKKEQEAETVEAARAKAAAKVVKLEKKMDDLQEKLKVQRQIIDELIEEPDRVTGHAFIVFATEALRNKFSKKFRLKPLEPKNVMEQISFKLGPAFGFMKKPLDHSTTPKMTCVKDGSYAILKSAPEPREVYWQNLPYDKEYQYKVSRQNWGIILAVNAVACAIIVGLKLILANYKDKKKYGTDILDKLKAAGVENPIVDQEYLFSNYFMTTQLLTGLASLVSVSLILIFKVLVLWLVKREKRNTLTLFQRHVFKKLTVAYLLNFLVVPMAIGIFQSLRMSGDEDNVINQAWYEDQSIVFQVLLIVIVNAFAYDANKVIQPESLFKRYVVARFQFSQVKQDRWFTPPRMHIGEMYAATIKTIGMGLLYGPLYPPIYLITAFGCLFCYWCTRYGISRWFRRPAAVNVEMFAEMQNVLTNMLAFGIFMSMISASMVAPGKADGKTTGESNGEDDKTLAVGAGVLLASPILWLIYKFAPIENLEYFRPAEQIDFDDEGEGDTKGIRFDEVEEKMGQIVEAYECPLLAAAEINEDKEAFFNRTKADLNQEKGRRGAGGAKRRKSNLRFSVVGMNPDDMAKAVQGVETSVEMREQVTQPSSEGYTENYTRDGSDKV
jgi:hypothetical protein